MNIVDKITSLEWWGKWLVIAMFVILAGMCFSSAFDRTQDIARVGRVVLAIGGFISIAIAAGFYGTKDL